MNIALLSLHDQEQESIFELTLPAKREYCQKHGYTLVTSQEMPNIRSYNNVNTFLCTLRLFRIGFDAVMVLNPATVIMNQRLRIEDRLLDSRLVFSSDLQGISNTIYIATSDILVKQFLFALYVANANCTEISESALQEKTNNLLSSAPYKNLATTLSPRSMNARPRESISADLYEYYSSLVWQPGDWLLNLQYVNTQSISSYCLTYLSRIQRI